MSEQTVVSNQREILGNQEQILADQERIEENQGKLDRLLTNQATIIANQERLMAMDLREQGVPLNIVYLGHRDGTTPQADERSAKPTGPGKVFWADSFGGY